MLGCVEAVVLELIAGRGIKSRFVLRSFDTKRLRFLVVYVLSSRRRYSAVLVKRLIEVCWPQENFLKTKEFGPAT